MLVMSMKISILVNCESVTWDAMLVQYEISNGKSRSFTVKHILGNSPLGMWLKNVQENNVFVAIKT